jgi:hypothetical protein
VLVELVGEFATAQLFCLQDFSTLIDDGVPDFSDGLVSGGVFKVGVENDDFLVEIH